MPDPTPLPRLVRFGTYEVDLRSGELRKNGQKLKIQEQPFHVLAMLLEHPGDIVTREELQKALWPDGTFVDFEHGLNKAINKIREALGDDADNPRFVETVGRRGYRFIYPVAPVEAVAPVSSPAVGAAMRTSPLQRRIVAVVAAAVVAIVAALLALNVAGLRDRMMTYVRARHGVPLPKIESIAVLPLENLSGDKEQEYFADGMTEELITNLGKISALRVISRTSVMRYKQTKKPLPEIARELNVEGIVEGTVQRSGNRVRITANLLHAPTDRHLWGDSYESDLQDVLVLQGEVARAIAEEVRIKLTPEEQTRLVTTGPVNPEAYQALLKGRFHMAKLTKEDLGKAAELFDQATAIDPNYAPAYAALASLNIPLGHADFIPPQEAFPRARRAAEKALAIDPTLAEGHIARASARFLYDWDWAGAERDFARGLKLNPNDSLAHRSYADFLSAMGRPEEAIREGRRALDIDPVSLPANSTLGIQLYFARRYDEAIEQERKTLDLDSTYSPAHLYLGWALIAKGDFPRAIAETEDAIRYGQVDIFMEFLGYAYALAGDRKGAIKVLAEYQRVSRPTYKSPFAAALIYTGLGEKQRALDSLEKLYENRDHDMVFLRCFPWFDPLRSDPRFQDLLRRMNYPK